MLRYCSIILCFAVAALVVLGLVMLTSTGPWAAGADEMYEFVRKQAMMAVADRTVSLVLTGTGDVLEPEDGLIGIGSGGGYALSAARALMAVDALDAETIARRAMKIAAEICVYTNETIVVEKL